MYHNILFIILFLHSASYAKDIYKYIDLKECQIPISKNLKMIEKGKYVAKDIPLGPEFSKYIRFGAKVGLSKSSLGNLLEGKNTSIQKTIYRKGYKVIYSKYNSGVIRANQSTIFLGDILIVTIGYKEDEINHLIDYCAKHPL